MITVQANVAYKPPSDPGLPTQVNYKAFRGGTVVLEQWTYPFGPGSVKIQQWTVTPPELAADWLGPTAAASYGLAPCGDRSSVTGSVNYQINAGDVTAGGVSFRVVYSNGETIDNDVVSGTGTTDQAVAPSVTVVVTTPASVCPNGTVTITPTVTGGAGPYTLVYTNMSVNPPVKVGEGASFTPNTSTPGTTIYKVCAIDKNGCSGCTDFPVTVNPLPTCTVSPPTASFCSGPNGSQTFAAIPAGGTAPYTFLWSSGETTQTITKSVAGTYSVTITDSKGCTTSCSATLTVNPAPTCVVEPRTAALCGGPNASQTFTAIPSGGTPPYTFAWSSGETTASISKSASGTYTVLITDAKGCTTTCAGTLTVNPSMTCVVSPPTSTICSPASQTFTAFPSGGTAPYTYLWNTGETTQSITKSASGVYTVTITDSKGCVSRCEATLTVNPTPTCSVSPPRAEICGTPNANQTFTANAVGGTPPYTYAWNSGETTQSITKNAAGTYTVTITDSKGCITTCSAVLTVNAVPACYITPPNAAICRGSTQCPTFTVNPLGGTAPYTIVWSNGTQGPTMTTCTPGTYTATVTDAKNCVTTCQATLTQLTPPTCNIPTVTLCPNKTGALTVQIVTDPNGGAHVVSWLKNGQPFPGTSSTIIVSAPGAGLTDSYTANITDNAGCTSSCTGIVTQYPTPCVFVAPVTVCYGKTATLTATPCSGTPGTLAAALPCTPTFTWTGPGGATASGNPIQVSVGGDWTVTMTDCNGCQASYTTRVTVDNLICKVKASCGNCTTICAGSSETFSVVVFGGVPGYTYEWKNSAGVVVGTGSTYTTSTGGTYTVTVTDSVGCTCTDTIFLKVDTVLTAWAYCTSCSTPRVCGGSSVEISAYATGGTGPFQYYWTPGGETTQMITVNQPGVYTLSVIDAIGCTAVSTINVLSCEQCVTRDVAFWKSRLVVPSQDPCVALSYVFELMNGRRMNLGFMYATFDDAVGIFWAQPARGQDDVCTARKDLAKQLIAAIANVTLLNADSSSCGVSNPDTGAFVRFADLIAQAQAATQPVPNILDCSSMGSMQAWLDEMDAVTGMLSAFNAGGVGQPLPGNLIDCGVGRANAAYIAAHSADPTTAATCNCPK